MINRGEKKLIILPAKTGTTSITTPHYALTNRWHMKNATQHATLLERTKQYQISDINDWTIYQTARHPIDRFHSAIRHVKRRFTFEVDHKFLDVLEKYIDDIKQKRYEFRAYVKPFLRLKGSDDEESERITRALVDFFMRQSQYCDINNIKPIYLKLENIEERAEVLGIKPNQLYHINKATTPKESLSQDMISRLYDIYKQDFLTIGYKI